MLIPCRRGWKLSQTMPAVINHLAPFRDINRHPRCLASYLLISLFRLCSSHVTALLRIRKGASSATPAFVAGESLEDITTYADDVGKDIQWSLEEWPPDDMTNKRDHAWSPTKCDKPGKCCCEFAEIANGNATCYADKLKT